MDLSLKPSNMVDFTSLFYKEGWTLEKVIGTTYCLNFETLLMLILAIVYGPGADTAMDKKSNEISPAALMAAIRLVREKELLTIFCQRDKARLEADNNSEINLLPLLDDFISPVDVKISPVDVKNDNGAFSSFHSKVWLIAFREEKTATEGALSFRLIVTSRNLTSNRDFDAVAVYESSSKGSRDAVNKLEEQIGTLPEIFNEAKFETEVYSFSEAGKIRQDELKKCHSVFSPFLDADRLLELKKDGQGFINIFSMGQEIRKVLKKKELNNEKCRFFELNPDLHCCFDEDATENPEIGKHFGLHAKMYISGDENEDGFIILGSSNFTYRGLMKNREFNVKINSGIKENDLLKSLGIEKKEKESDSDWLKRIQEEDKGMFLPYQEQGKTIEELSPNEEYMDKVLQYIASCSWEAKYKDGNLTLQTALHNSAPPNNDYKVSIKWRPLLEGNYKENNKNITWQVAPKNVCSIFVCKISINGLEKEFQIFAKLSDDSGDIWKKRFQEERKKIRFEDDINFRMLDIENINDLYGRLVPLKESRSNGKDTQIRMPQPPIFERLLELNDDQLEKFFQDPPVRNGEDPLNLYDAFVEMGRFFGMGRFFEMEDKEQKQ